MFRVCVFGIGLVLSMIGCAEAPDLRPSVRSNGNEPRNALAQPYQCMGNWPQLQVRLIVAIVKRDEPDVMKTDVSIRRGWVELEPSEQIRGKVPDRFKVAYAYRPNQLQAWSDYHLVWPDQKLNSGQRLLLAILPNAINPGAESYPDDDLLPAESDGNSASARPGTVPFQRYPDRVREIGAAVRVFAVDPDDRTLADIRRMADLWDKAGTTGESDVLEAFGTSGGAVGEYVRSRQAVLANKTP